MDLAWNFVTCWLFVTVRFFGLVVKTWASDVVQDGWPYGPLTPAGMNSTMSYA